MAGRTSIASAACLVVQYSSPSGPIIITPGNAKCLRTEVPVGGMRVSVCGESKTAGRRKTNPVTAPRIYGLRGHCTEPATSLNKPLSGSSLRTGPGFLASRAAQIRATVVGAVTEHREMEVEQLLADGKQLPVYKCDVEDRRPSLGEHGLWRKRGKPDVTYMQGLFAMPHAGVVVVM